MASAVFGLDSCICCECDSYGWNFGEIHREYPVLLLDRSSIDLAISTDLSNDSLSKTKSPNCIPNILILGFY